MYGENSYAKGKTNFALMAGVYLTNKLKLSDIFYPFPFDLFMIS